MISLGAEGTIKEIAIKLRVILEILKHNKIRVSDFQITKGYNP